MRINHNISALNAYRQLAINNTSLQKSLEKLSSGYRINRAGDDAAGLAISEKMRAQIRGLNQAVRNAQDGISLIQTAEGALQETHAILQRMRELVIQAANDTNVDVDRAAIKTELDQLSEEIDRIAQTTQFNKQNLLDGTFGVKLDTTNSTLKVGSDGVTQISIAGAKASETYTITQTANKVTLEDSKGNIQVIDGLPDTFSGTLNFDKLGVSITVTGADLSGDGSWGVNLKTIKTTAKAAKYIQIGANEDQKLAITLNDMQATALGVAKTDIDVSDYDKAKATLTKIENAIGTVSIERANLGAWQNRLEHTINNLSTAAENLTASESRIRDVDMAQEMMEFTKLNILQQAATAMLAQANMMPQSVLKLLG